MAQRLQENKPRWSASSLSPPRLAEMVASSLRNDILSGVLNEGDELPRQEILLRDFGVSLPAIREALRILENEGLITVRRGNVGGAIVHVPTATGAAYMTALVLQRQEVTISDVGIALVQLEPSCAALCAMRPDRLVEVVPVLERWMAEQEKLIEDMVSWLEASRAFHRAIVEGCQNETMMLVIGTLETIWSSHEHRIFHSESKITMDRRRESISTHEELTQAIRAGESDRAADISRRHLAPAVESSRSGDVPQQVVAELVRGNAHGLKAPGR